MGKKYFVDCGSLDEIKIKYKSYVEKYLPRKEYRGNKRLIRSIDKEYRSIRTLDSFSKVNNLIKLDYTNFQFLIRELIEMGLDIEMCGKWLFVHGSAGENENELLALGFRFSPSIGTWCYRPFGFDVPDLESLNMEYIRRTFGSDKQALNGVPVAKTNPRGRGEVG